MARLSVELQRYFFEEERQQTVTLVEIMSLAEERVFGFLFVLLSLPAALPIPAPGIAIPFGIAMFLLAIQLVVGATRPWLPRRFREREVGVERARRFIKLGIPWLRRLEALSRPRMSYVCGGAVGRVTLGVAIALMSVAMMIPLPWTNTLPAIGIFVTGVGLIEDDGAVCLGGLAICAGAGAIALTVVGTVLFGGMAALQGLGKLIREGITTIFSQ